MAALADLKATAGMEGALAKGATGAAKLSVTSPAPRMAPPWSYQLVAQACLAHQVSLARRDAPATPDAQAVLRSNTS